MARSTADTARVLRQIYDEEAFDSMESEPYLIAWDQLRGIAGVERLTDDIISDIGKVMLEYGYLLVPLDNFLLVDMEVNHLRTRKIPARIVESYLVTSDEESVLTDEDQELGGCDE